MKRKILALAFLGCFWSLSDPALSASGECGEKPPGNCSQSWTQDQGDGCTKTGYDCSDLWGSYGVVDTQCNTGACWRWYTFYVN